MKRACHFVLVAVFAAEALVIGQGADVNRILADVRTALGGESKLAAVKSLTATGHSTRVSGDNTSSAPTDFEMALELPDKFVKKDTVAVLMDTAITRTSGFNGDGLIDAIDSPPAMGHGMVFRSIGGASSGGLAAAPATPEEVEATRKAGVLTNKQEFARLTLGMFATSLGAYPLQFSYEGEAQAPGGKADIIVVKGEGDFSGRLFVDAKTHLPLMLTWMAKEPLMMNAGGRPGGTPGPQGSGMTVFAGNAPGGRSQMPTAADRDKIMKDMDERMKQAEAQRKVVEYRMYYGDFKAVDGVKLPFQIQRSIDGKPTEELVLDKVRVNAKIDPKKFETVK